MPVADRTPLVVSQRPLDLGGGGSARWRHLRETLPRHGWRVVECSPAAGTTAQETSTDPRVARLAARRARVMGVAGRMLEPLARVLGVRPEALAPNNVWGLTGRRLTGSDRPRASGPRDRDRAAAQRSARDSGGGRLFAVRGRATRPLGGKSVLRPRWPAPACAGAAPARKCRGGRHGHRRLPPDAARSPSRARVAPPRPAERVRAHAPRSPHAQSGTRRPPGDADPRRSALRRSNRRSAAHCTRASGATRTGEARTAGRRRCSDETSVDERPERSDRRGTGDLGRTRSTA